MTPVGRSPRNARARMLVATVLLAAAAIAFVLALEALVRRVELPVDASRLQWRPAQTEGIDLLLDPVTFDGRFFALADVAERIDRGPDGRDGLGRSIVASADGERWAVVAADPFGDMTANALRVAGDELLASGTVWRADGEFGEWATYRSGDAVTWRPWDAAPARDFVLFQAARLGPRWISADEGSLLVSEDGVEWREAAPVPAADEGPWLAAAPDGAVAWSNDMDGDRAEWRSSVWWSRDGLEWWKAGFEGIGKPYLSDVLAGDAGFIALGTSVSAGVPITAAWASEDGSRWHRVPVLHAEPDRGVRSDLEWFAGGALAWQQERASLWWAPPGGSWRTVRAPAIAGITDENAIATLGRRVLLVGDAPDGATAAWVGVAP